MEASQISQINTKEWKAEQNLCFLPFQYGCRLDRELARQDALYALSELIQFAASSEVQFLNLLQSRIQHELSFIRKKTMGEKDAISLLNLKYVKTQLTIYAQQLGKTVNIFHSRNSLG